MRSRCATLALAVVPLLCGCDFSFSLSFVSGDFDFPAESAVIASDPATDGDVRADGAVETADVILAGADPLAPPAPEYRGFLSFPLAGIPVGAWIESATVTVTVDRVDLSGTGLVLSFDRVRYGDVLSAAAFDAPGTRVGSLPAGVTLFSAAGPQLVSFNVVPELQAEVNDPSARFFQLRARAPGGLASIVDGAGNRAGGLPTDRSLAPALSVTWRP
ncbi:MAG: hypothetical protein ACM31I_05595 [Deltaproteobacteria bacterium]